MGMSMNVTMMQNNNRGLRHGGVSCREHLLTGGWSLSRSVQVLGVNPQTASNLGLFYGC